MLHFDVPDIYSGIIIEKKNVCSVIDMPEMHSHLYHELYFLLSGERRYFIGHNIYDVSQGNLVIIPKTELHRTTALNSKGYERYVLYFFEDSIDELIDSVGHDTISAFLNSGCIQLPTEYARKLRTDLEDIDSEKNFDDKYSYALKKNLLQNIILNSMRYGEKKNNEKKEGADKIQEVALYISENYASEITLQTASQMAFMSDTYFSRKFRLLTGFGFKEYLVQTRVRAAEGLLRSSNLTIIEISDCCGFSSSNYFGDVFKSLKGLSPSEYRKKFSAGI